MYVLLVVHLSKCNRGFLSAAILGRFYNNQRYKNNIFVGDYNNGNLYYFEVNNTRTGIKLDPTKQQVFGLSNLVLDNSNQLSTITFGNGFGGITDIKTGPADGFLYILSTMEISTKSYHSPANDDSLIRAGWCSQYSGNYITYNILPSLRKHHL